MVDLEAEAKANGAEFDDLFDSWSEEAEEAAIQEAAKAADVKYIIVEGKRFVARFPDGVQLSLPLDISLADIQSLEGAAEGDQMEQVKMLLSMFGGPDDVATLEQQNLPCVVIFAEKYFRVFERVARAALGE